MPAVKDFSTVHSLVGDLFRMPSSEAEWKQYELSKEQIERGEDGRRVFSLL